uniref:RING-type domain-containing protein n=1 Tax=Rhabditophanes sp. KR3021 TaxID=114890 RepID=A0AC35U4G4_9BILA
MCLLRFCCPFKALLGLCSFCVLCNICKGLLQEGAAYNLKRKRGRDKELREANLIPDLTDGPPSIIYNHWCIVCKTPYTWRIVLRNCEHPVCLHCALNYTRYWIQEKSRVTIKCPKRLCCHDIHPNDIYALLDEENEDLDMFMAKKHRQWLLFKYERDNYWVGLGGEGNVRQCPICLNAYQKWPGCNYVQCVFPACKSWFCFQCGLPIDTIQHFCQGSCSVGFNDIAHHAKPLGIILSLWGCELFLITPLIFIFLLAIFPLGAFYYVPQAIIKEMRRGKEKFKQGSDDERFWLLIIRLSLYMPFILILCCVLAIGTFFASIVLCIMYLQITCVKMIPPVSNVYSLLERFSRGFAFFGIDMGLQLIQAARQDRLNDIIEEDLRFVEVNPV